jgi:hypothetical protein
MDKLIEIPSFPCLIPDLPLNKLEDVVGSATTGNAFRRMYRKATAKVSRDEILIEATPEYQAPALPVTLFKVLIADVVSVQSAKLDLPMDVVWRTALIRGFSTAFGFALAIIIGVTIITGGTSEMLAKGTIGIAITVGLLAGLLFSFAPILFFTPEDLWQIRFKTADGREPATTVKSGHFAQAALILAFAGFEIHGPQPHTNPHLRNEIEQATRFYLRTYQAWGAGAATFISELGTIAPDWTPDMARMFFQSESFRDLPAILAQFPPGDDEYLVRYNRYGYLLTNKRILFSMGEGKEAWAAAKVFLLGDIASCSGRRGWTASVRIGMKSGEVVELTGLACCPPEEILAASLSSG